MNTFNAEVLLGIFGGLVRDVEEIMQLPLGMFEGDLQKVTLSVKSRGIRVLLLDLPSLCSALEQGLESGKLETNGELFGGPNGLPSVFTYLWSNLFDEERTLKTDACPLSVRCLRQLLKCFKRFRIDPPPTSVQEKFHEFERIEEELVDPNLSWGEPSLTVVGRFPNLVDLGRTVNAGLASGFGTAEASVGEDEISELLRDLSFIQLASDRILRSFKFREQWFKPKHGPGAVSEQYKNSKFEFPSWTERLEQCFPYSEWGMINYSFWDDSQLSSSDNFCKVIDVPKDYRGPRLIASEPISAQYIQQGLMQVIRKNVAASPLRYSIDFRSQEPSKEGALQASLTKDFSTIDLSSASDRLSCALVECIFRNNYHFLEILNSARTGVCQLPSGERIKLKKFAAQGAAFTFPIQSIVYTMICVGVLYSENPRSRWADLFRKVRVYGDDMIVPTHVFERVCRILEILGLKVNRGKSFSRGNFRESCGLDAFKGVDVTSISVLDIFCPRSPGKTVSVVEQSNNLYLGGYLHASRSLLETIHPHILRGIAGVLPGSTVFGFYSASRKKMKQRWNHTLQRYETKCLIVENKVTKSTVDGPQRLFQWLIEKPSKESVWSPGYVVEVKARYRLRWVPSEMLGYMG